MLLFNVEDAYTVLASKSSVKIQKRATKFARRRLPSSDHGLSLSSIRSKDIITSTVSHLDSSGFNASVHGLTRDNSDTLIARIHHSDQRCLDTSRHGRPSTSGNIGRINNLEGSTDSSPSVLYDASVQVDLLKHEVDRAQAGILLLSSSIERLQEVVRQDSRGCCGSTADLLFSFISGQTGSNGLLAVSTHSYDSDDYERVNIAQPGSPLWDNNSEHSVGK